MKDIVFIYNPHCTKCGITKKILEDYKTDVQVVEYLSGQLTEEILRRAVKALQVHPKELLRTREPEYSALKINLDNADEVIAAILEEPILLERPIVLKGERGVIGRPPENILKLFS